MLAPSEVGWDLALYAQEWLEERFRLTLKLAADAAESPTTRAVHDLRVACRRLREAVGFFQGVVEVPPLSDVDRAARRMARVVRDLRELDVAMKRLADVPADSSDAAKRDLLLMLKKRRRKLAKKLREKITKRVKQLETAIKMHLPLRVRPRSIEIDPAREAELRAFVEARVSMRRAEVERLFDAVRASRDVVERESERLHAIRVAIKHWRYASEIARAVMPRVLYRPMAARLRHLQDLGGKSQDFSDLASVVEDELERDGKGTVQQKKLVSSVRAERARAAREFYEALKTLVPPSGSAT